MFMFAISVTTAMVTTDMRFTAVLMIVMITMYIRIEIQPSRKQSADCLVRTAADAAVQFDTDFCQRGLCAASNAAADQNIHMAAAQKASQCPMSASMSIYNLRAFDFFLFNIIDLELCRMAKMLKHLSIFIGYCNSHCPASFLMIEKNWRSGT